MTERALSFEEVYPSGVNGHEPPVPALAVVLDETVAFLQRYMAMTQEQFDAVALWVAHTHAVEHFDVCAYMHVSSADKRCGKSLLLDLLEHLVLRGRSTANISPAALYRMIDAQHPTLLFDEIDNIFTKGKNADPSMTALTGLINAGFRKGRVAYRMGGANMRTLEEFDPFGPKALAGIGSCLPDTTADRAIPIKLTRKGREVTKARYRIRIHEAEAQELGVRIGETVDALTGLGERWPDLPGELNDRQQDIWEPLLAIADVAAGDWPDRARRAAKALHGANDQAESVMTKLLNDIRSIYEPHDDKGRALERVEKMLTKHIAAELSEMEESPWGDWRAGQGISAAQLVMRLREYGIRSKSMRVGDDRGKGFEYDQLAPVFSSYLSDDTDDTDDAEAKDQARAVIAPPIPTDDASDDTPDQGEQLPVITVTTVTEGVPRDGQVGYTDEIIGSAP